MRLFKKDNMDDFIISKDLSIGVTGMLNSLLVRTNYELENTASTLLVMIVEKMLH